MIKKLLIFLLLSFTAMTMPAMAYSPEAELGVADMSDAHKVALEIKGAMLKVSGAAGETLEVVSLTGKQVMRVKISNHVQNVELNIPKGCYIVKVGNVVRKVSIG